MGRNYFDAGHVCPETNKPETWKVLIGEPSICPVCLEIITPKIHIERESPTLIETPVLKPGGERLG